MHTRDLGKICMPGEEIIREGSAGNCMYVLQDGQAEVIMRRGDQDVRLGVLSKGDFFGEMALFERGDRSATVRALSIVRVLTVDKKTLLRRIQEDPTVAFRMLERMSHRIRDLDNELARLKSGSQRV